MLTTSLFSASCIAAAAQATAVLPSEVAIPRSVRHQITSKMNNLTYKLSVFLPRGYETGTDRYPVLYVVSGETFGPYFAEMTRFLAAGDIPKIIVVGIDFTDGDSYSMDLPTAGKDSHWDVPEKRGAANFLKILLGEMKPFIDGRYRTIPGDNGVAGQSMAGFFALYAFLHAPDVFQHVYASSPSMVWQDNVLLRDAKGLVAQDHDVKARVFTDVGGLEPNDGRLQTLDAEMTSAHLPSLRWRLRIAENQSHQTIAFADGIDALYSIYGPYLRQPLESELAGLAGTYCASDKRRFSLQTHDHRLFVIGFQSDDDSRTELLTTEPNEWFIRYLNYTMVVTPKGSDAYSLTFHLQPTPGPNGNIYTPTVSAELCSR
ncbi:alpha/beta hydrolase [Granulicella sp. L60]|uniref:alpha/beta hydrolase n=1 Tax=Granulicella sp. L60 TaxID=1641866 RepID=UPI00131D0506|nr:alpha/beta hydrolase-fold protein [Granulicella sp. L60]